MTAVKSGTVQYCTFCVLATTYML